MKVARLAVGGIAIAAGADSVMVVTPYYYRPTQQGIVDYFRRVSDAIDGDLVLYEINLVETARRVTQ